MTHRGRRRAHRGSSALALFLFACGGEAAPATIAPEPAPAPPERAEPREVETSEGAPTTPAAPTPPADVEIAVFSLPDHWAASEDEFDGDERVEEVLDGGERVVNEDLIVGSVPTFETEPPAIGVALSRYFADGILEDARGAAATGDDIDVRCDVLLAHPQLVSVTCVVSGSGGRTGFEQGRYIGSARVLDGRVVPVVAREAFAPGVDLDAVALRVCREEAARMEEDGESDAPHCDGVDFALVLGRRGIHAFPSYWSESSIELTLRYDDPAFRGQLRLDGPLAAILPIGARSSVTFGPDQVLAAELAAHPEVAFAVGPRRPLEETLLWLDSEAAVRADAVTNGASGARVVRRTFARTLDQYRTAEAEAQALATEPIVRVPSADLLGTHRYLTTEELALRATPSTDGGYLRTLPIGTRVMGLEGTIDGLPSSAGARGSWIRVVAAEGVSGWVAGRYVASHTGRCGRPSAARIAAGLPAEATGASVIFGDHEGSLVVIARGVSRSWVAISDSCALTPVQRLVTVPDRIDSMRFLGGRGGGPVLLITSATAEPSDPSFDGTVHVMLVAPGATEPGWTTDARAHPALASAERAGLETNVRASGASWDVAVRVRGEGVRRARWDGATFVESTGR